MNEFLNDLSFDIDKATFACGQIGALVNSILVGDIEDTDNTLYQMYTIKSLVRGLRGELENINDSVRNALYAPIDEAQNIMEAHSNE